MAESIMTAFLQSQASRLSIALDHVRADARMGRAVNTQEIEQVIDDYCQEIIRLESRAKRLEEEIEAVNAAKKLSVPIEAPLESL